MVQTPNSRKQSAVSYSNTRDKYRNLANAKAKILWVQTLLVDLVAPATFLTVYCDNQSAVSLAYYPILYARIKHMELDFFFREKVLIKQLRVLHVLAQDQCVDTEYSH